MRIQLLEGEHVVRDDFYSDSLIRIGSHDACTLHLPDLRITPQHVTLFRQIDGSWLAESTLIGVPTYLNGHHLKEPTQVKHGDELLLLEYRLKLMLDAVEIAQVTRLAVPEEVSRIRQYPLPAGSLVRKIDDEIRLGAVHRQSLAGLAFQLRACDNLTKLMDLGLNTLLREFNARMAWIGLRHNDYGRLELVESRVPASKVGGDPPLVETIIYRCLERTQLICAPTPDFRESTSFLAVPLVGNRGRIGIVYVESKADGLPYGERQLELLMMIATMITTQAEAIFNEQAKLQEAVTAGEQSFLRQVQTRLDPTSVPQWEGYQMAAYCKSGMDNVGDVYDVMRLPNGMMSLLLANAVGEPTRVAMSMAEVRAAFRVAGLHADPPHTLLRELDWILHDDRNPCVLHCAMIILNPKTGVDQYAMAGDIGAVVVDDRGEPRYLADAKAPAVCAVRNHQYASKMGKLKPSESLILYSPGCLTIRDAQGNSLGQDRFVDALGDLFGQAPASAIEELVSDLAPFFKQGRNPDDITLLVLRRED